MKTTTEKLNLKAKETFLSLYSSGISMGDIMDMAKEITRLAQYEVDNNTINGLSNGRLLTK